MKKAIIIALLLILSILAFSIVTMPQEQKIAEEVKPFAFDFSINQYGILDNNEKVRGYLNARIVSTENASIEMMLLPDQPKKEIYKITDYRSSGDKDAIMNSFSESLRPYRLNILDARLEDVLYKQNAIIILPSDAIPDELLSGKLNDLIENNVVIFFGKPLDIALDHSGSQEFIENELYDSLDINYNDGLFSARVKGPKISSVGNATVFEYEKGWFVIYNEKLLDLNTANELRQLVLREAWQSQRTYDMHPIPEMDGAKTFFTSRANPGDYTLRIIYHANNSVAGINDLPLVNNPNATLIMKDQFPSNTISYIFELQDNLTFPTKYDFSLQFVQNGEQVNTVTAKSVTMKTFSREGGTVSPDITAGSYVVNLIDQSGRVHASAYTSIPEIQIKLIRISNNLHTFKITIDGEPAILTSVKLIVNNEEEFGLKTDKEGEVSRMLFLPPGTNSFTTEINGQSDTTYYRKPEAGTDLILYAILLFILLAFVFILIKSKGKKKWKIKTYTRPSAALKVLRINYDTFIKLFEMTQEMRAKNLPLSVSDLRMGLRKHATYKGAPLFITDSNLYMLLDNLVKKERFLYYSGYFLPKESAGDKPIEYWVIKRRITDYFVEKGEELRTSKDADFIVRGKLVHIWHDLDIKNLVKLCEKSDNIILFSDDNTMDNFVQGLNNHDPSLMKLSLELQYGRLYCETLDKFLERGFHGQV
ncbi:hypothetical protein JXA56_02425 [Candidatus Micrarchaeota archaeon]|nr:hypothetical protein [Candidatus Micrarchaeota archaeon]